MISKSSLAYVRHVWVQTVLAPVILWDEVYYAINGLKKDPNVLNGNREPATEETDGGLLC